MKFPTRLARLVALIALTAYVVGSAASAFGLHAHAFQRFGSLGVAAAILFFTDRLAQIELSRQASVERLLREYGVELEALKAGLNPRDLPPEGYDADYLSEAQEFSRLRLHADRINSRNVVLLTLATLQWGFGDLALGWLAAQ